MAEVPYEHVEAPVAINIGGSRAFNVGDPVPIETARRIGLMKRKDIGEVIPAKPTDEDDGSVSFVDGPIETPEPKSASTSGPTAASKTPGKSTPSQE